MSKAPIVHHRPRVHRGKALTKIWWSKCPCGHVRHFWTWKHAYIDALRHSEELK